MSGIVFAGIAPHPPLLIPDIGGSRIEQVRDSQRALGEFSRRLVAARPQTVVVISPHSPLDPQDFTVRASADLQGDFRDFYARHVRLRFPNDPEMIETIKRAAVREGVRLKELARDHPLDHGAMVPLYYLLEAGWEGPTVVIGFTHRLTEDHLAFGRAIETAARESDRRVALVASGDLSHRLIEDGPYEYEPTAHLFDEQIVAAIKQGDARGITNIDHDLRLRAGECGYRSILVALGSVRENLRDHQVLSYEGPFGVGYLVAVLFDDSKSAAS
ncbi:MAG: AmmeMemoRadiSam system protein B [Acidobacteriota bacterium]